MPEDKKIKIKERFKNFFKNKAPHVLEIVGDFLPDKGGLGIIKNIIEKDNLLSHEDKIEFNRLFDYSLKELELINKDNDSARKREIEINKSKNSSWLVKNIVPILAIVWTIFSMVIFILILVGKLNISKAIIILIVNSVSNIIFMIIGYYFGSSQGSKDKQKELSKKLN